MSLILISIKKVKYISEGIWKANLDPSEVRQLMGNCENTYGDKSIILLTGPFTFKNGGKLEFEPLHARPLNIGNTTQTIIISSMNQYDRYEPGDEKFLRNLKDLPQNMKLIGEKLLIEIRKHFRGDLKYHQKSRKYVESPDNFWTVKPQPRDKSFRITVRGVPEKFDIPQSIELKPDMAGYSTFKISKIEQIDAAIHIIRQAYKNKRK